MHIDTQKASIGMYSECDYPYKSCSGDYLVTLIAKFGESGRSVANRQWLLVERNAAG